MVSRKWFLALASVTLFGCGTRIDLGGTPPAADASRLEGGIPSCAGYAAPDSSAKCMACSDPHDCPSKLQPNGCYGGYYCDLSRLDCQPPSDVCDGGHVEGGQD